MMQLAAGTAHCLNNLLAGISGNLELAMRPAVDTQRRWLEAADAYVQRAAELTRQLMMISPRTAGGPPACLQVDAIIARVAASARGVIDGCVGVWTETSRDLPAVRLDAQELDQALRCLCDNAAEAMADLPLADRRLDITAATAGRGGAVSPGTAGTAGPQGVRIVVADTGAGIGPGEREHVFEPFFTTKDPRLHPGLGLTAANAVVRRHGGWLELSSRPGLGTTAVIYLPAAGPGPS